MPFTATEGQGNIPAGTYTGMLEAVNVKNIVGFSGVAEDMWEFHFQINVNGELKPISGLTSQKMTPAAKARKWIEALLRRPMPVGETVEDPIGQNALVVIGPNKKGYSTILDVLPAPTVEQTTLPDGSSVPR